MKSIWEKELAMVFWANSERSPTETILDLNRFLARFGEESVLAYLNETVRVDMDRCAIEERNNPDKRQDELLTQSYFSQNRIWVTLSTGSTEFSRRLDSEISSSPEVLQLGFDLTHIVGEHSVLAFEQLLEVFEFCVGLFDPFYGWFERRPIGDKADHLIRIFKTVDSKKVPMAIQWFNYFSTEWVNRLGGIDKLLTAPALITRSIEHGGCILILQREVFNHDNLEHQRRRDKVETHLSLSDAHERYPRD